MPTEISPRSTRSLLVAMIAVAVPFVTGCGQGDDRDDAVASFAAANPDATDEQSECVVDLLIERYGLDELEARLLEDPPDAEFEEAQFRDMFTCGLGLGTGVEAEIAAQLEANGVTPEDAPCVADELVGDMSDDDIDVLLSGDITEDFMGKFIDAMDACGAINN